jgi:ElaB/YqjD/DUF883 family membrane-anchored ribosome-binding protein
MSASPGNHAVTDNVADHAHVAVDKIAHSVGKGEQGIRETGQQVHKRSEALVSAVHEFVRDNPMTSIGLAFAAGTIVSILARRH